jgi:ubiquinone/menaquinone biosynthesis C-methylase UbiE
MLFDPERELPVHARFLDPLGREPGDYPMLRPGEIDEFVQNQIVGTGGHLYSGTKLTTYPRPRFPIAPPRLGATVVDVGAGWGRWSFAAAAQGWNVAAVDPWVDCCRAMYRLAKQANTPLAIASGDGRRLPLPDNAVDAAFSYSVIQHLPKHQAEHAIAEMARVVKPGGIVLVQMPNVAGVRQRQQRRRGLVADKDFHVRPWTIPELRALAQRLSPYNWRITADGFFSLNAQWAERRSLSPRRKVIVAASESLRRLSVRVPVLVRWADSVWLEFQM